MDLIRQNDFFYIQLPDHIVQSSDMIFMRMGSDHIIQRFNALGTNIGYH